MTYASGGVGGSGAGGRVSVGQQQQQPPLGPRNSLDYWQKVDGRHGVTTYYWNAGAPYYGLENVYATPPPGNSPIYSAKSASVSGGLTRRPAPFPLSLPPGPPLSSSSSSYAAQSTSPIVYHNLPRVRLPQSNSDSPITKRQAEKDEKKSPIVSTQVVTLTPASDPGKGLIWSVGSHNSSPDSPISFDANGNPTSASTANDTSHYGIIPSSKAQIYAQNSYSDKKRQNRSKPRWGRFVQSLCCCISPDRGEYEKQQHGRTNPALLITQVQKNGGSNGSATGGYSNGNSFDGSSPIGPPTGTNGIFKQQNEYMPTPTMSHKPPNEKFLLPQIRPADVNKKCLIIDLDETLVHSSFKPVKNPDFVIPVEIDGVVHQVYVLKRPCVDEFLARVGDRFECVLFTASLAKYADPVADLLDKRGVFRSRLFREACVYHKGNYVKDLARLGRDLSRTIIIDNSPASYAFHPDNAIPVQTWFDDPTDVELLDILPILDRLEKAESVYMEMSENTEEKRQSNGLLERNGITVAS